MKFVCVCVCVCVWGGGGGGGGARKNTHYIGFEVWVAQGGYSDIFTYT